MARAEGEVAASGEGADGDAERLCRQRRLRRRECQDLATPTSHDVPDDQEEEKREQP